MFLSLALFAAFSQAQVPTSGLIGAWTFSGNANDVSGNNNNGSVTNASLTTDRCGNPNSAYQFNGNGMIVMQSGGPLGNASRSISFWTKTTNTTLNPVVAFDYGFIGSPTGPNCWQIQMNYGCVGFGVDVSTNAFIKGPYCLNNGAWHHVVAVWSSTMANYGTTIIYIDGVPQPMNCTQGATTQIVNTMTQMPVTIGRSAHAANRYFNGTLDDFYFYNRDLTPAEVMQLYTLTICPPPIIGNTTVCSGSINNYSISIPGASSYTWTAPSGWSGTSTSASINLTAGPPGTTIINVAGSSSCGVISSGSLLVNVVAGPTLAVSSSNATLCTGSTATLTASGANSYTWQSPVVAGSTIAVMPLSNTFYTVVGFAGTCTAAAVFMQPVSITPSLSVSNTNTQICTGVPFTLTANGSSSYTWLPGNSTGSVLSTSVAATMSTYTLLGGPANGCTTALVFTVGATASPTLSIGPPTNTLCNGATLTLQGTGANTYTWLAPTVIGSSLAVSPTVTTTYTLTGTSVGSCTNSAVYTASVLTLNTLSLNTSSLNVCQGTSVFLSASIANSYTWLPVNLYIQNIVDSPTVTTTYTVNAIDALGCLNSATITQIVKPQPTLTATSSNSNICSGKSVTLSAGGALTHSWSPGGIVSNSLVITPTASVVYSVLGTAANGCTNTIQLSQNALPNPTLITPGPTLPACNGSLLNLTAVGAATYTWNPGNVNGNTYSLVPVTNTSHTVTGTAANGCTATSVISLSLKPMPTFSFNTFSITCASLGSATIYPTGGIGPFTYTWVPTNQTGSAVGNLPPGTFTINVHDAGTVCNYSPTTVFAPLVPMTGTVSNSPSVNCNGEFAGTASIGLSGGSAIQNYSWTTYAGTQNGITATLLPAGVHTVTVIDALTFCTVTKTFVITQPTPINFLISSSSPTVCLGNSINFSAIASGGIPGYTYTWQPSTPGQTHTVTETLAGTYIYTISATDANTCVASSTVSVGFISNPTVSASSSTVCTGKLATLTSSGATTYTWNGISTGNTFTVIANATNVYTVQGTTLGCTSQTTVSVNALPLPVVTFTTNSPVCVNDTLRIAATSTAQSYLYTGPNFVASIPGPTLPNIPLSSAGIYTLMMTGTNACTNTATRAVVINTLPVFSAIGSTVCEGGTITLSTTASPTNSFSWQGPSFTSTLSNPIIGGALPLMGATYSVTVTNGNGCKSKSTTNVSVTPTPVPIITTNGAYCDKNNFMMTAGGGQTYTWTGPANYSSWTASIVINNVSIFNSGIYTLTLVKGPCKIYDTTLVTIYPNPQPTLVNNSPVCEKHDINLQIGGGANYNWTGPAGVSGNSSLLIVSNSTPTHTGVYNVTVSSAQGCQTFTSTTVLVIPNPTATVKGDTVCIGETAVLTATGGSTYLWQGPSNFSSTLALIQMPVTSTVQSGTYTVTVTGNNGCAVTDSVKLLANIFDLPVPVYTAPRKTCEGTVVNLSASGGTKYLWRGPLNYSVNAATASLAINNINNAGTYTLTVTNASNCSTSATLNIAVYPPPRIFPYCSNNGLCLPFCSTFSFEDESKSGKAPIVQSSYLVQNTTYKGVTAKHCFTTPGNFTVNVSGLDSNGCAASASIVVQAFAKPDAGFLISPELIIAGQDEVKFTNTTLNAGVNTKWQWLVSNLPDTLTSREIRFTFNAAGSYPVVLIASNPNGCKDTMVQYVMVQDEGVLYFPNSFTPNEDGLNDIFQPKGNGLFKLKLEIFTRWGILVYSSNEFLSGWDGSFNGKPCPNDVYIWKAEVTNSRGKIEVMTGTVTLVK